LESLLKQHRVTFEVIRIRLVRQVRLRINNGEFTERGLSRILGISQSQTHNVLKGARQLKIPLADLILKKLDISAVDLLSEVELTAALRDKTVKLDTAEGHFSEFLKPKKPPGRSGTKRGREEKTG
jgi:hypothetical protein